jgi:hypothetical protein
MKMTAFWDVLPFSLRVSIIMAMMEAVRTSETSI